MSDKKKEPSTAELFGVLIGSLIGLAAHGVSNLFKEPPPPQTPSEADSTEISCGRCKVSYNRSRSSEICPNSKRGNGHYWVYNELLDSDGTIGGPTHRFPTAPPPPAFRNYEMEQDDGKPIRFAKSKSIRHCKLCSGSYEQFAGIDCNMAPNGKHIWVGKDDPTQVHSEVQESSDRYCRMCLEKYEEYAQLECRETFNGRHCWAD